MSKHFWIALAALAATALATPSFAKPFSNLFIFSGSLTDTGNFASVNGDFPAPFYNNRTSNGPVAVDIFAAHFGFKAEPSLHLVGPVRGNNFASVGALTSQEGPAHLSGQLDAFFAAHGNRADPDALYFVFIGGNDVILAATEPDPKKSKQIIKAAVDGIETGIERLVNAGAKTILAPNFIDIGPSPAARNAGISEHATAVSRLFNKRFARMLHRVERRHEFELIRFDFDQLVNDTLANADALRFTNTTESCLALLASGQCDFDHFVYFNEAFPTARVHNLLGNALALAVIQRKAPHRPR